MNKSSLHIPHIFVATTSRHGTTKLFIALIFNHRGTFTSTPPVQPAFLKEDSYWPSFNSATAVATPAVSDSMAKFNIFQ